ncbi:MAG: YdcF family protein [Acidobacteriia bacterium]|nr:YdcF family protein [Terriglobia bacterium]
MGAVKRRTFWAFLLIALCVPAAIAGALAIVNSSSKGRLYSSTIAIPHRELGLILGCSRHLQDGSPNPFFDTRLLAASELFHASKVDYLLVSGDNHTTGYDEATDMRNALRQAGVPADHIYCDCAGFRTLDSVVRTREVFGHSSITVISQEFHNQRAIFLASHHGVDAIGYNAQDADLGDVSGTHRREKFARIKAVLDIYLLRTRPRFLGSKVSIGVDAPTICSGTR